jgi:hypothetical protein
MKYSNLSLIYIYISFSKKKVWIERSAHKQKMKCITSQLHNTRHMMWDPYKWDSAHESHPIYLVLYEYRALRPKWELTSLEKKKRDNCITSPWGWLKLQITPCDTKSSWRVPVVNYNCESLPEPIFRPPS